MGTGKVEKVSSHEGGACYVDVRLSDGSLLASVRWQAPLGQPGLVPSVEDRVSLSVDAEGKPWLHTATTLEGQ